MTILPEVQETTYERIPIPITHTSTDFENRQNVNSTLEETWQMQIIELTTFNHGNNPRCRLIFYPQNKRLIFLSFWWLAFITFWASCRLRILFAQLAGGNSTGHNNGLVISRAGPIICLTFRSDRKNLFPVMSIHKSSRIVIRNQSCINKVIQQSSNCSSKGKSLKKLQSRLKEGM